MDLKLQDISEPLGELEPPVAEPHSRSFWFSRSDTGPENSQSQQFPGDANAAGPDFKIH